MGEAAETDGEVRRADSYLLTKQCNFRCAVNALSRVEACLRGGLGNASWEGVEALAITVCEMQASLEVDAENISSTPLEDFLPVFVLLLVRSKIEHPAACVQIMRDVLAQQPELSKEKQMVALLGSATDYVTSTWDVGGL